MASTRGYQIVVTNVNQITTFSMEHCNVDVSANRFDPAFLIFGLAVGTFGLVALHYTFPKTLIISKWNLFHTSKSSRKKIRVFLDGCFDMMHYGHANALRQAKALGDQLVVGVVSDEEIIANKGPPVMKDVERCVSFTLPVFIQPIFSV